MQYTSISMSARIVTAPGALKMREWKMREQIAGVEMQER